MTLPPADTPVTTAALPVATVACYARKSGDDVLLVLQVPGLTVAEGSRTLRLRRGNQTVWPQTTAAPAADGVRLEARVPAAQARPGVWRIAVHPAGSDELVRLQARLVVGRDQPVAVLTGPIPKTEMPPHPRRSPSKATGQRSRRLAAQVADKLRGVARRVSG